ncbi:MAG: alanine--tRNA ligase [Myxococcales bacterium]|nr:MAG: alanine--tRNA ligase [Myxococcales bacterium]
MARTSREVREEFLKYFEAQGHKRMHSSSLIPLGDPTLLFTNAGMNQFKDVFTGKVQRPAPSATTAQKCMRVSGKHNDLENVGRTARHHTFFEMLGNFSFGDYFKHEAIRYGYELVVERLGIDPNKLWFTVYKDDDEAYQIWTREIGAPADRVVRMDEKSNFWSMGDVGPCGPCSEIHVDQGEGVNGVWRDETIWGDSDRFLEIWNLVFMQFYRDETGKMTPLPSPSVDTGAGLERMTAVLQGKTSNYETDLFQPLIAKASELCGKLYRSNPENDVSMQVIADHARATTFLIGDGMLPSNEHRGYVLRRIMRRAIRHGHRLGLDRVFMPDVCETVIREMGDVYPELVRNRDFILNVAREEEKSFRRTLAAGLEILGEAIARLDTERQNVIPGDVIFKLYDTFGFPVDLTEIIAGERGKTLDQDGFAAEMEKQRARGRASWKKGEGDEDMARLYGEAQAEFKDKIAFTGYERDEGEGRVLAIFAGGRRLGEAPEGVDVEIVVDKTPFYAESGGQVGDRGLIVVGGLPEAGVGQTIEVAAQGGETVFPGDLGMVVMETQKPLEGLIVHKGRVLKGVLKAGVTVRLAVDAERRNHTRRNHSATHLLQYALRSTLGTHVKQSGSWVGPDRLRFDFTHFQAIKPEELQRIEAIVNAKVRQNAPVETVVKPLDVAQKEGAIAFFGEKYGEVVRVVTMSAESVELCGGTHVSRTGDIGLFKILHESSIASGVRRIEAATGLGAVEAAQTESRALAEAAAILSTAPQAVPEGIRALLEQQRQDRKRIEQLQREKARLQSAGLLDAVQTAGKVRVLCVKLDEEMDPKTLRDYAQEVLDKLGQGVLCLAVPAGDKVGFTVAVSADLQKALPAGKTIAQVAAAAGAKGGGRPDLAQAGGGDPSKVEAAFAKLKELAAAV